MTFKNGQVRHWQLVQATSDGTYELAGRGSYLAVELGSEDERVMILEASGHAMVYLNGEPQGGDPYAHGYVRQPIQLRKGSNTFLFQAGRDRRITARLRSAAASSTLNPGDLTTPDLVVNKPVNTEAAIVVLNASRLWSDGLAIVSRLPGGEPVPTNSLLPPMTIRKVGFRITGPAPPEVWESRGAAEPPGPPEFPRDVARYHDPELAPAGPNRHASGHSGARLMAAFSTMQCSPRVRNRAGPAKRRRPRSARGWS